VGPPPLPTCTVPAKSGEVDFRLPPPPLRGRSQKIDFLYTPHVDRGWKQDQFLSTNFFEKMRSFSAMSQNVSKNRRKSNFHRLIVRATLNGFKYPLAWTFFLTRSFKSTEEFWNFCSQAEKKIPKNVHFTSFETTSCRTEVTYLMSPALVFHAFKAVACFFVLLSKIWSRICYFFANWVILAVFWRAGEKISSWRKNFSKRLFLQLYA